MCITWINIYKYFIKKTKSCDDSTSIKNNMDGEIKRLLNQSIARIFSVFDEMLREQLKCLSARQQIYTKKLMYDALHIDI